MNSEPGSGKEKLWTKDFVLLALSHFLLYLGFQMLLPTLPVYVSQHGGNQTAVGLVIGIFALSALLIRPFSGAAVDTYSRKLMLIIGVVVCLLSIGGYFWTTTVLLILLLRVVHGFGWGISTTAYGTVASDLIPATRRGEGIGYFGLAATIAMALGPLTGIWLMDKYGFGVLFLITGLSTVLAFALAQFVHMPAPVITAPNIQQSSFVSRFIERDALFPSLLMLLVTVTFGGIVSFITLFANEVDISNVGWFFFTNALFILIVRPFAGKLFDEKGHFWVLFPGAIFAMIGVFLLSNVRTTWELVIAAVFYGIGYGAIQPSLQAWTINLVAPNRRGAANGTLFSAIDLGYGGGSIVLGAIANATNYATMYRMSAVLLVVYLLVYTIGLIRQKRTSGTVSV